MSSTAIPPYPELAGAPRISGMAPSSYLARALRLGPGLASAGAIGGVATVVGHVAPVVGAPVVAIALGLVTVALVGERPALAPGSRVATHSLLRLAVVLLGFTMPLGLIWHTAAKSTPVMLGTIAAGLLAAAAAGRLLEVRGHRRVLVAVGTAICGASAIAATSSVIEPEEDDVAYAITVIFVFNVAAVLTFPTLGHLMHMNGQRFGLWAGTSVNDLSSVVAATSVFGHGALSRGVIVKLARTLMIVPITAFLGWGAARARRRDGTLPRTGRRSLRTAVPGFLVLFVLASIVRTLGLVGAGLASAASQASLVVIAIALAGVGLSARPSHIRRAGLRPLALGALCWAAVALTSLGLQSLR